MNSPLSLFSKMYFIKPGSYRSIFRALAEFYPGSLTSNNSKIVPTNFLIKKSRKNYFSLLKTYTSNHSKISTPSIKEFKSLTALNPLPPPSHKPRFPTSHKQTSLQTPTPKSLDSLPYKPKNKPLKE